MVRWREMTFDLNVVPTVFVVMRRRQHCTAPEDSAEDAGNPIQLALRKANRINFKVLWSIASVLEAVSKRIKEHERFLAEGPQIPIGHFAFAGDCREGRFS